MKIPVNGLVKAYGWLMKLYPSRYQQAFADERQQAFAMALEEALQQGKRGILHLALGELRDLPASVIKANLREWEVLMKTIGTRLGEERLTWLGFVLGVWPFLFAGPLMAVLPYLPGRAPGLLNIDSPVWWGTICISVLIGILVGWRKGFPSWVYPYLMILFFAIVIPMLSWLSILLNMSMNSWISTVVLTVAFVGFGAAALFLLNRLPATRNIFYDIRNDWTRLTFGMFVFLAFGMGVYTGDHLPPFGAGVLLPSIVVVLGAVAYLFCRGRLARSVVLVATLGISILGLLILQDEENSVFWPILSLWVALFFSPVLVGLVPRTRQA